VCCDKQNVDHVPTWNCWKPPVCRISVSLCLSVSVCLSSSVCVYLCVCVCMCVLTMLAQLTTATCSPARWSGRVPASDSFSLKFHRKILPPPENSPTTPRVFPTKKIPETFLREKKSSQKKMLGERRWMLVHFLQAGDSLSVPIKAVILYRTCTEIIRLSLQGLYSLRFDQSRLIVAICLCVP